jgi:CheY-like chemotaxis protein
MVNQRILVKLLTSLGCDTSTCNDGQECVDLLVSLRKAQSTSAVGFDLVLMDLEMYVIFDNKVFVCPFAHFVRPVLDGLGATRQIRQLESDGVLAPALPIVAVSGNARPEWTVIAREAGMDGFVRKPYGKAELAQVVSTWRQHARI